ncbi:hypothetical protein CR513_17680, partial [Mucuna pruriens]
MASHAASLFVTLHVMASFLRAYTTPSKGFPVLEDLTSIKMAPNISIPLCKRENGAPTTMLAAIAQKSTIKPNSSSKENQMKTNPYSG